MTILAPRPAAIDPDTPILAPGGDPDDWADYYTLNDLKRWEQISADIEAGRRKTISSEELRAKYGEPELTPAEMSAILDMIE